MSFMCRRALRQSSISGAFRLSGAGRRIFILGPADNGRLARPPCRPMPARCQHRCPPRRSPRLSPLDGRYAAKLDALRPLALGVRPDALPGPGRGRVVHRAVARPAWPSCRRSARGARALLRGLVERLLARPTREAIKAIERHHQPRRQGGRVLARRALRRRSRAGAADRLPPLRLHQRGHQQHQPRADARGGARARCCCRRSTRPSPRSAALAATHAAQPMLARTHGQTATPTTLGKELANVAVRLRPGDASGIAAVAPAGQDERRGRQLQRPPRRLSRARLGRRSRGASSRSASASRFNPHTTQIEPHDALAELFDAIKRGNTVLIDWARDAWGYISLGYFTQKAVGRRDRLEHDAAQGQPDRLRERRRQLRPRQRAVRAHEREAADLALPARPHRQHRAAQHGRRLRPHACWRSIRWRAAWPSSASARPRIDADLDAAWEVLAEPVQTVMRRHGIADPYEQLKALTRGKAITREVAARVHPRPRRSRRPNATACWR